MSTLLSNLVSILYLLNFLIAFVVIFLERKNPTKTLTWIMVLFLLPGIGFFCYVMFSQNISRQKLFRLTTFEEANISNSLYHQMAAIKNKAFPFARPEAEKWADMIHLNQVYGSSYFTQDNNVEIFIDGNDKFRALFDDILHAEHSIHVMYYILQPDELGLALIDLLAKKAREGVEVRLLLDAVGSRSINK
ncbi:MAG: PLDc N-terminal domain-containing protein, partial [Firmicutes bacterium]|nr:PLDc N-terminal domain-containing protein [Bacillota bacterium]